MEEKFSQLINLLWGECIANLNNNLEEEEQGRFSNNDYYYLLTIHSMNQPNLSEIAKKLNMTKPAVTGMISKLEKMNLVRKIQSEIDKRMYHVSLTVKGKKILNGDREIYKRVTDTISFLCKSDNEKRFVDYIINELLHVLEGE